jgi:aminodeoxyfutalosine deaminase
MKKFSADFLMDGINPPQLHKVITTDSKGKILLIDDVKNHDTSSIKFLKGMIIPGLINTHCHLELSHMKGMVPTGTTLIPFITDVVTKRATIPEDSIQIAIKAADKEMFKNGIVAVGDISNQLDTNTTKNRSKMHYHTFVEMFDFLQEGNAKATFDQYFPVYKSFKKSRKHKTSAVPHAPYSVSKNLFQLIAKTNAKNDITVSIHNQETKTENDLFIDKNSDFVTFFGKFGIDLSHFQPIGKSAIHYALQHMDPLKRTLFVHNTMTTPQDIEAAKKWSKKVYWATCPNANLYIENRLPNYQYFLDADAQMTIGTDSLTSNWQLSILEEMKTIRKYQSFVPFQKLIEWATINGAQALGFDETLGSIEVGKTPGLNLLSGSAADIDDKTTIKKLI